MKGKDFESCLERRVTTLNGCFDPLMSALHAYEEKSRTCLSGDLLMKSGEDAVNEMYDVLESVERCESLYSAVMRETSRCFEVSKDLMYLIKSVEEKCRSDYKSILAMKKSAIVMLEASEKRLSCEEMRVNVMRREVLMTKLSTNEAEEIARHDTTGSHDLCDTTEDIIPVNTVWTK
ncbi:hypothetical protein EIN_263690 [Entamoeba invadens IP1]|uniref:Uncharacterized protein n=1 Tax=Entamoeba invadens IP1 TaxID=370355 RepID=L7FNC9_ENTIV|nr:hypothetical protein EIN_263690 [Entamoeba invadens IP1]ELP92965.1 hypothetical protein EIN_263690 [Entamoeba invadens IP1]|eukprot:XP_004259736.1 hypothetical protein EIN_263690 [Entamoeba invadens IP1]